MRIHESRIARVLVSLAAGAALAAPARALVDYQFSAVWREDAPANTLVMVDDFDAFEDEIEDRLLSNETLYAFESWGSGDRDFAGLFRTNFPDTFLFVDLNEGQFAGLREDQLDAGHVLLDVEVRNVGGALSYSGLFVTSLVPVTPSTEFVLDDVDAATLEAWWDYVKGYYHLETFDTWLDGSEPRFYAVFHLGAEAAWTELTLAVTVSDFLTELAAHNTSHDSIENIEVTPVGRSAKISAKWVNLWKRGWLGISFYDDWLVEAANNFIQGQSVSTYDVEDEVQPPTEDAMYIYDLEITELHYVLGIGGEGPALIKPLIDSGTPGPPKP